MSVEEAKSGGGNDKLVIRNIGLLLSGDIDNSTYRGARGQISAG